MPDYRRRSRARSAKRGGHEAEHAEGADLREGSDGAIWAHALQTGAVILTKDEDSSTRG